MSQEHPPRRLPDEPPKLAFFEARRPAAGDRSVSLTLGPLEIRISGLESSLADTLIERFTPYSSDAGAGDDALQLSLAVENSVEYFIAPSTEPENVRVLLASDDSRVRYLSYRIAGWFDTSGGRGQALITPGGFEPAERALENFIRAAVAWQAASRGGMLVHAASAVLDGKGYLFYGESGAGKSTLSECNRRARIVSDDLSLLMPGEGGRLHLVGSPFRGTYTEGAPVEGCFPLQAGFRIVKADHAEVREISPARASSELVGNLPFVAESFHTRPDLFAKVLQALRDIPLAHLHFRKDDSYWDAIAAAGL